MSTTSVPETAEITTAREILHDVDFFSKCREYERYWVPYFTKRQAEAMREIMNNEISHEQFLVQKALYKAYSEILGRPKSDEEVNNRLIAQFNKKNPPKE
jgi:hypothetical protein